MTPEQRHLHRVVAVPVLVRYPLLQAIPQSRSSPPPTQHYQLTFSDALIANWQHHRYQDAAVNQLADRVPQTNL